MSYLILSDQVKREVCFGDAVHIKPIEEYVRHISNSDDAHKSWLIIIGQDPYPRRLSEGSIISLDKTEKMVSILKAEAWIDVYIDGTWYRIERSAFVDPYLDDVEDPKEFLATLFDDLINRPSKLQSWVDYQAQSKKRIHA